MPSLLDNIELPRKIKRFFDSNFSYRKIFLIAFGVFMLIWLLGFKLFNSEGEAQEPPSDCLTRRLLKYYDDANNYDAKIIHYPPRVDENYLPYVGNGLIGLSLYESSKINIKPKIGRVLSVGVPFRPIIRVAVIDEAFRREAVVLHFNRGVVERHACIEDSNGETIETSSKYFAHRAYPSVFEQVVSIRNPGDADAIITFEQMGWTGDPPFKTEAKKTLVNNEEVSYLLGSGVIESERMSIGVAIAYHKVPNAVTVRAKSSTSIRFIFAVNYVYLSNKDEFVSKQSKLLNQSEQDLKRSVGDGENFFSLHENAWKELWSTGFYISSSKAVNALNGDKINATMYYVLSQVRDPLHEANIPAAQVSESKAVLSYAEGCYGGHHTLQAQSLWSHLSTIEDIRFVSNLWLITLEKNGCHKLVKAGALGVIQGMVLSFGALKFSNQHLEFNTEPKDLHRDYLFRRVWYGNATHLNISVSVGEDNKASLAVAVDRSDKDYYACDAGCLDTPVELGPNKKFFPVKQTEPSTAVLYITSDKLHVEELRLSIHVKEVVEAPAHENHVISMHKHGSGYGPMSTMFWVFISLVIIFFHLFLFHLVYTEYFGSQDKFRTRKVSDF